jgi:hypothetical protein
MKDLKGVRAAHPGRGGTIRSVTHEKPVEDATATNIVGVTRVNELPPGPQGILYLDLSIPGSVGQDNDSIDQLSADVDTILIGENFATITRLVGVHEATDAKDVVHRSVEVLENFSAEFRAV